MLRLRGERGKGFTAIAALTGMFALTVPPALADEPSAAPVMGQGINWTGAYLGGHLGYAWGSSDWTTSFGASGSFGLGQPINTFNEAGSFFAGLQVGYNYLLPNRVLVGVEADATFPSFHNLAGISIGGVSTLSSPVGKESFSETMLSSGSVRGRLGYAPSNWLFYATGGFAWTHNQQMLTQLASGTTESPQLSRFGWTAGAGVEVPLIPHWTAGLEYRFTDFGSDSSTFSAAAQRFSSDFLLQELRVGLSYRFSDAGTPSDSGAAPTIDPNRINIHGQTTFVEQAYPTFRSPFQGINSLPGVAQARETWDATFYAGVRLWQGGELWVNPELDQGHGLADTHGVAGFPSGEAYKSGFDDPYARVQRYFLRQTVNLGGESEKVDADLNQFAGSHTADRLVLTVGRFAIVDIFDTNKYANNSRTDFSNWSVINAGTFDYAGDGWGFTYGAAAEWYFNRWTLRAGVFDLSETPAGGISPAAYGLDSTFQQFQLVGEIEERHKLWSQPGKIKVTGFLSRGRAGEFKDAIELAAITGQPANINAVRHYTSRPGLSINLEQQVTDTIGVFARAGWADGSVEPWDFTDIDRTLMAGISLSGKAWGRKDDTIGIAGVINGISSVHEAFLNAGGLGILIGDGQLRHPGLEHIIEAYYSYALTSATRLSFDYQFIDNPAYNTDRGPVNFFSGRVHWQF